MKEKGKGLVEYYDWETGRTFRLAIDRRARLQDLDGVMEKTQGIVVLLKERRRDLLGTKKVVWMNERLEKINKDKKQP